MDRFTRPNLANTQSFVRIRRRHMEKLDPKLANFYNEHLCTHFFVKIAKFGVPYVHEFATDSCETSQIYHIQEINQAVRLIFWPERKQIWKAWHRRSGPLASRTFNCYASYRLISQSISRSIKELICFLWYWLSWSFNNALVVPV